MRKYILLFLVVLFLIQCGEIKVKPKHTDVLFDDLFVVTNTYEISGTNEQPVFAFGKPVKIDDLIYFPERMTNMIHVFNLQGILINKFGGSGKGPGDLQDPINLSVNSNNKLIVNEVGNIRFQKFNKDGESETMAYMSSFSYLGLPDISDPNLIWAVYPFQVGTSSSLFHLIDLEENTIIKNIGAYDGNDVLLHGWVADIDDTYLYVANVLDDEIKVFDKNNSNIKSININSINSNIFLNDNNNQTETSEGMMGMLNRLNSDTYTSISGIFRHKDFLIVLIKRNNYDQNQSQYFIDIYDTNGTLNYSGIDIKGELIKINENELAIINTSEEGNGNILVHQLKLLD